MIKLITKNQFYSFENTLNASELNVWDITIMGTMHEFIDNYDDDEITVYGYFNSNDEPIGLIRFSEEDADYLFEESNNKSIDSMTLIGALFVLPTYRGKGIGRELVDFAISEAETDIIVTDPLNIEARHFFKA